MTRSSTRRTSPVERWALWSGGWSTGATATSPPSETVKMISMVRDGEGVVAAANGYYAVATGTRAGNTQSFPSGGAAAPGVETAATGSFLLTTVSSLVMPLIALALNWGVDILVADGHTG